MSTVSPPGRYTSDPLLTGAWQVSDWNAGQSSIVRWSPKQVKWDSANQTLDFTLDKSAKGAGAGRPFVSGEVQSKFSAYEGTWSWTAMAPDLVSGSIFGLFTFQADWSTDKWLEFDFEFLGKDGTDRDGDGDIDIWAVRLNIHMENAAGQHVTLEDKVGSVIIPLGFDATETYATYSVNVTKDGATFLINGQTVSYKLADGTTVSTFTCTHMPDGTWTVGETQMKSFINLWAVDPSLEGWAGKWTYPGKPLVGKVAAAEYTAADGTKMLLGGTGGGTVQEPTPTVAAGGTGNDQIADVFQRSDVLKGGGGQDTFLFVQTAAAMTRGGTSEKDVILDFNPVVGAEKDVLHVSKALAGVSNFSGLYRKIADKDGDAVLSFADGSTLRFDGLLKADLSYDDFVLV